MEKIHGLLSVRCGAEDGALVILKNGQPVGDVGSMVGHDFRRDAKVGAEKSTAQVGNQFFACIALVTPLFAAEVAVKAGRVLV